MKTNYLSVKLLLFFIVGSLIITSCESNDTAEFTEPIAAEKAIVLAEVDDISDEINTVIDDFVMTEGMAGRSSNNMPDFLSCITKTIVFTDTTKTVTLDFGEGCTLPNAAVLSGKIIMTFAIDFEVHSFTMTYAFENFYYNDISVEGENTIVRVRENENGNPQSTLTINVKVTWPNGDFASREGTKIREWIEGYNTRTWGDNVFLISGNWTAIFKDGTVLSANIIEALRREMACRFIVSGIVELQKNERTGTLNFGDGTCDDKAIFTNDLGEETEITLRGRMF